MPKLVPSAGLGQKAADMQLCRDIQDASNLGSLVETITAFRKHDSVPFMYTSGPV